jgi:diamine N-acetyltransferase
MNHSKTYETLISQVAAHPESLSFLLVLPHIPQARFRPLGQFDVDALRDFLGSLSERTRSLWMSDGYDPSQAAELCNAIGKYDKLRMVLTREDRPNEILGLFEYSFGIPDSDLIRFRTYGLQLRDGVDCRFGPCLRDELQSRGVASALMPQTLELAQRFGCSNVILWGGVQVRNEQALRFYRRHGFVELGRFMSPDGLESIDMLRAV